MTSRTKWDAQWGGLARRLRDDTQLTRVVDSLDSALKASEDGERKSRLRVPYANTKSIDQGTNWN